MITPLRAMRKFCLDCMSTSRRVTICSATECSLWHYRFGKRPLTVQKTNPKFFDTQFFIETANWPEDKVIRKLNKKNLSRHKNNGVGDV